MQKVWIWNFKTKAHLTLTYTVNFTGDYTMNLGLFIKKQVISEIALMVFEIRMCFICFVFFINLKRISGNRRTHEATELKSLR